MVPSLLVAAAITAPGAPVPADSLPNTTGPAPRVAAVKADASGAVWITAQIAQKQKVTQQFFANENGKQVLKQREVEQVVYNYVRKTIGDFGGKFATAAGTPLTAEEAAKRVKDGATLLVTADGKPVDKGWLRVLDPDAVIMVAEGLAHAHFQFNQGYDQGAGNPMPKTAAPRLARFCADESGEVKVATNPTGGNTNQQVYYDDFGGGRMIARRAVMVEGDLGGSYVTPQPAVGDSKKPLSEVKFDAYDRSGKLVPRAEALKRLKAGGLVLLAGDTRFPDPDYLTAFRDDILVLVAADFVFPMNVPNPYDMPVKADPKPAGGAAQPVPAVGLIAPPALQLKVAPAVIKQAAADAEKAAADAEKKAAAEKAAKVAAEKAAAEKPIKP